MPNDLCQTGIRLSDEPVVSAPGAQPLFSSKLATERSSNWGGPRPNSGGPRPNSGGARPNSGPKPKPPAQVVPLYAVDVPMWRVFATWGQAEISAARELTRQGYTVEMPLIAIRRRDPVVTSIWHTVRVPLFPGYGFIHLTNTEAREPIAATHGVRELLHRPNGKLSVVADAVIDRLRAEQETRLQLPKETAPALQSGTLVRITGGAFADHAGTVLECDGVRTRVEMMMFGRTTPFWLDRVLVEVA